MNLFHVIANHPSTREVTTEPLSAGLFSARPDAGASPKQDFSKLFSQSMKSRPAARQADVQRQDIADEAPRSRNASIPADQERDSSPEVMTRDARFAPGRQAARAQDNVSSTPDAQNSAPIKPKALAPKDATQRSESAQGEASPPPPLTTMTLAGGIQIITTDRPAITEESLATYARKMGLDESTIQKLLSSPASAPLASADNLTGTTVLPLPPGLALTASPLIAGTMDADSAKAPIVSLESATLVSGAPTALQPQDVAVLKSNALLASAATQAMPGLSANKTLPGLPMTKALPASSGIPPLTANMNLAPPTAQAANSLPAQNSAPPLPAMTEAMLNASWPAMEGHLRELAPASALPLKNDSVTPTAQPLVASMVNLGILEPKPLVNTDPNTATAPSLAQVNVVPNNATIISTAAILSMLSHDLSSQAVDELADLYDKAVAIDSEDLSATAMSTLDNTRTGMNSKMPSPAQTVAQLPTNMAEVYEKLSAKLNTELAARMHQQISDGQWKMKFALKPASLGAVDIQLEMRDGKLAAMLQAENPLTQDLLRHGSDKLKQTLSDLGLAQASVQIGQGQSQGHAQGHRSSPSETAQFRDNPSQVDTQNSEDVAKPLPRRNSLSQFDLYA